MTADAFAGVVGTRRGVDNASAARRAAGQWELQRSRAAEILAALAETGNTEHALQFLRTHPPLHEHNDLSQQILDAVCTASAQRIVSEWAPALEGMAQSASLRNQWRSETLVYNQRSKRVVHVWPEGAQYADMSDALPQKQKTLCGVSFDPKFGTGWRTTSTCSMQKTNKLKPCSRCLKRAAEDPDRHWEALEKEWFPLPPKAAKEMHASLEQSLRPAITEAVNTNNAWQEDADGSRDVMLEALVARARSRPELVLARTLDAGSGARSSISRRLGMTDDYKGGLYREWATWISDEDWREMLNRHLPLRPTPHVHFSDQWRRTLSARVEALGVEALGRAAPAPAPAPVV